MSNRSVHACRCDACLCATDEATRKLHHQVNLFVSHLNEQQRRWWGALEAQRHGHGGVLLVTRMTGLTDKTIRRGMHELGDELQCVAAGRVRREGGGRPVAEARDPVVQGVLEQLLASETAGDPMGLVKYKRSSLRHLSEQLKQSGHAASPDTVARLLRTLGYSPRANVRRKEARSSPRERDAQFQHIQAQKHEFLQAAQPVISVDTKKKGAHR
ncbi:MAG: hypothetical protein NVS2B4_11990 [Ramlibacter sp.]